MDKRKVISFLGITAVNCSAMLIVCGVGLYGYAAASEFGCSGSFSLMLALESVARCAAIPVSGVIGERVGHKRLYLVSVAVYIASYAAASMSGSFWLFTAARTISGAAWGLFATNSIVLLSKVIGSDDAPRYSSFSQTAVTAAMALGSPLSGALCEISWRVDILALLPVMAVGWILCAVCIPDGTGSREICIDRSGVLLVAGTLVPFVLAMNLGGTWGWDSPLLLLLLGAAAVSFAALLLTERRAATPVIPLRLLKDRRYLVVLLVTLLFNIVAAVGNYIPSYVQSELGISTFYSSLVSMPGIIIAIVSAPLIGLLTARSGKYRAALIVWALLAAAGCFAWWLCDADKVSAVGCCLILMTGFVISGPANGFNQILPYTFPIKALKAEELAEGTAFMGWSGVFGATVANGLSGAMLTAPSGMQGLIRAAAVPTMLMLLAALFFRDRTARECVGAAQ